LAIQRLDIVEDMALFFFSSFNQKVMKMRRSE